MATTTRGQRNATGWADAGSARKSAKEQNEATGPPSCGALTPKSLGESYTAFKRFYDRGDLPVQVDNGVMGCKLRWKCAVESLDFHHYLPIFFDGLRECGEPYLTIAKEGCHDMLEHGGAAGKVRPCVAQLIIPIKKALETRHPAILCRTVFATKHLVLSEAGIGEDLVPYYRQILPILNIFKGINRNLGDNIDYSQKNGNNLGDLIQELLEVLELNGGDDAYINIKYMIPTYESCVFT